MAIKGKSRKGRSKARAPAQGPRPTMTVRRTPVPLRRDVKRAVVIALTIASLVGGLRVWENVSRSDSLRAFNRKLSAAEQGLIKHLLQTSPTNVDQNVDGFTKGTVSVAQFDALTKTWETDFTASEDKLKKLKAPNQVAADALKIMIEGIDGYVGFARLYNVAAQIRSVEDGTKDPKVKKAIEDRVLVVLQHAKEWRDRADRVYTIGNTMFTDLKIRYGVEKKAQPASNSNSTSGQ